MLNDLTHSGPPTYLVHPTRNCAYLCVHCYSSSTPAAKQYVATDHVLASVGAAAGAGYRRIVVSGGEPVGWSGLVSTLAVARINGMERVVESSGLGLTEARVAELGPLLDRLRIGIDGRATRHDVMHGRGGAFEAAKRGILLARAAKIEVEIAHTVRLSSLHELDWIADWAAELGATRLLFRPMEVSGRAAQSWIADDALGPSALAVALERADRVSARLSGSGLTVSFPMERAFGIDGLARRLRSAGPREPLASLLPQLVLVEDGTLLPLRYGTARQYALGNLARAPLTELVSAWRAGPALALSDLLLRSVSGPSAAPARWIQLAATLATQAA